MITAKDNVLIVGLGLIGGSYAKGLRKTGCHISAITRSQSTIDYALEHNIIDEGTIEEDPALIGKADFVIFGLYPHTMIDWIRRNQKHFKPGALLTCGKTWSFSVPTQWRDERFTACRTATKPFSTAQTLSLPQRRRTATQPLPLHGNWQSNWALITSQNCPLRNTTK